MTTARARAGRSQRNGFTLFEIIVVMALVAAVSGLVMTTLVRAQRRFRRATKAAEARAEIARAAERMLRDIRGARGAYVTKETGALVLLRPGGERVEWRLLEGRLVRKAPEDEFTSRARLAGLRVKVEKAAGRSPFVEVGLELEGRPRATRGNAPAPRGPVLYVGASPRAEGAKQGVKQGVKQGAKR